MISRPRGFPTYRRINDTVHRNMHLDVHPRLDGCVFTYPCRVRRVYPGYRVFNDRPWLIY